MKVDENCSAMDVANLSEEFPTKKFQILGEKVKIGNKKFPRRLEGTHFPLSHSCARIKEFIKLLWIS